MPSRPLFHLVLRTPVNPYPSPHQSLPMRNRAGLVSWCDCSRNPRSRLGHDTCDGGHTDDSATMLLEGMNFPSTGALLNGPRTSVAQRHFDSWRQPGPSLNIQCKMKETLIYIRRLDQHLLRSIVFNALRNISESTNSAGVDLNSLSIVFEFKWSIINSLATV